MNRAREYRLIMAGVGLVAVVGVPSSVWPVIDLVATAGLLGLLALAVAGYWGRELVRELRFRADMRALNAHDCDSAALATARAAEVAGR
ncbi:hypothetical protein [Pseudonocardia nigra]|uniref:hypothetical protein n=1 Tax=Pseudonocardia nigra TaxID=1921578 RepID=UPI001C5E8D2D|nr:hypothetical protein [Pseudonocardia nigra]